MTDQPVDTTLRAWVQTRAGRPAPLRLRQRVLDIPTGETVQRRSWQLPSQLLGYRSMSSALKFVAAAAIVVLFGGFLLAGVLVTQQDGEVPPAAVTESPTPVTIDELLPDVTLDVEEVEPGVFRVVNDGVRDLTYHPDRSDLGSRLPSVIAGRDGGIWVLRWGDYYRLGRDHTRVEDSPEDRSPDLSVPDGVDRVTDFEVAPDGTVWAAIDMMAAPPQAPEDAQYIWSSHGEDGVLHLPTSLFRGPIEVTPDGTVWAVWLDDPLGDPESTVFGYLGVDGWTVIGEWPDPAGSLSVSDAGEVWVPGRTGWFGIQPRRFADGAWHEIGAYPGFVDDADVGPEGTLWGIGSDSGFVRFDDAGWTTFEPPDWMPPDHGGWVLVEDEWVSASESDYDAIEDAAFPPETSFQASFWGMPWGEPHVAPDGSLWVPARLGVWEGQPVCDYGVDGVARHDGEQLTRYLRGHCIESMDIGADGSVWLLATESGARFPLIQTYVITPEAVAATE